MLAVLGYSGDRDGCDLKDLSAPAHLSLHGRLIRQSPRQTISNLQKRSFRGKEYEIQAERVSQVV
jgi:hypothetical protein